MTRRRRAFTLIELVISALLTSIMMAALLSILWSSLRQGSMLDRDKLQQFPMTAVAEQLRADFQNARSYSTTGRGISIAGFLGSDAKSGLPNLTPAVLRYETAPLGDHVVLVRRNLTQASVDSGVVRIGVGAIQLQPLVESDDIALAGQLQPGFRRMPSQFRLVVWSQSGEILFREVIQHHED